VRLLTTRFFNVAKFTILTTLSFLSLCLVDRASFINTLFSFQLDTLLFFLFTFTISFYSYSLHVSDRLVHHQENQITLAASGTFPSFVVISCVAFGVN